MNEVNISSNEIKATFAPTITITVERYTDLIRKEFVYEVLKKEIQNNRYATSEEKRLFNVDEIEVE